MLDIINIAAMNIGVHMSFRIVVFSGYVPSSGIAGLYGQFIPSFLRNLNTFFHNGCISFSRPPKCWDFLSIHHGPSSTSMVMQKLTYPTQIFFFALMHIDV